MNRPGPPGSLAALRRALDAGETSAVSLAERCLGFVQRCENKVLEVVLVKQSAANRLPALSDAA